VDRQYRRQTSNVSDTPVPRGRSASPTPDVPTPHEDLQEDFVKSLKRISLK
jgi:hypothetical protein